MSASGYGARERCWPWGRVHGCVSVVAEGRSSVVDAVALCQPWTMAKSVTGSDSGFSMISSSSSRTRVGGHIIYREEKRPDRRWWRWSGGSAPKLVELMYVMHRYLWVLMSSWLRWMVGHRSQHRIITVRYIRSISNTQH